MITLPFTNFRMGAWTLGTTPEESQGLLLSPFDLVIEAPLVHVCCSLSSGRHLATYMPNFACQI